MEQILKLEEELVFVIVPHDPYVCFIECKKKSQGLNVFLNWCENIRGLW